MGSRRNQACACRTHPIAVGWVSLACVCVLGLGAAARNSTTHLEHVESGEGWDGAWDGVGSDEGHDGDHGEASVVQFTVLLGLECGFADTGEVDWWEDDGWGGTSLHVVDSLALGGELGDEDGSEDLGLATVWDGIPSLEWLHAGEALEGDIAAEHAWEVNSGGLDDVSGGGEHGNASVLELGGAEPGKGLVTSDGGEGEWVEGLDWSGVSGHLIEGSSQLCAGCLLGGWGESSGGGDEGGEDAGLHGGN
mmetsp:Transcript_22546/g.62903  ORF Transcript_22546/g.62903 Transcript_22546/m.62903 type:complete len:250 (+) Transcript_22546:78-827(+)